MSKLYAGPFVGEFGHELFCWQGVLRHTSKNYEQTTIVCTPGKEILYSDFADKIITYKPQTYEANGPFNYGETENYPIPEYECDYIGPNTQLTEYYGSKVDFLNLISSNNLLNMVKLADYHSIILFMLEQLIR